MNRATLVYIIMLAACGGGLWAVLGIGAKLEAPPNLSGLWYIEPTSAGPSRTSLGETMEVEQSGRFYRIHFSEHLQLDLKQSGDVTTSRPSTATSHPTDSVIHLAGGGWVLRTEQDKQAELLHVTIEGSQSHAFTARRHREEKAEGEHAVSTVVPDPAALASPDAFPVAESHAP